MTINLIPPKLKTEKEIGYIFSQAIFGLTVIVIMLVIMSVALFLYSASLKSDIKKNDARMAQQEQNLKDYKDLESSIRAANNKLLKIETILPEKILWSEVLTRISSFTPKQVQIKTMELSKESNSATVSGIALTRKDIALFKERLEQNGFKNVTFSSSSYNQSSDDYTFSLTLELGDTK